MTSPRDPLTQPRLADRDAIMTDAWSAAYSLIPKPYLEGEEERRFYGHAVFVRSRYPPLWVSVS